MSSFAKKAMVSQCQRIYLVRAFDRGRPCYLYIFVDREKTASFTNLQKGQTVDYTKFGKVIECGWGENPPAHVAQKMKEEYNYEE